MEHFATCTLANITEDVELHPLLVKEKAIQPIISQASASHWPTRGEACRALANLASNPDIQALLLAEDVFSSLVQALDIDSVSCQRFATLAISNLCTSVAIQVGDGESRGRESEDVGSGVARGGKGWGERGLGREA